jgi:hypothetical protein
MWHEVPWFGRIEHDKTNKTNYLEAIFNSITMMNDNLLLLKEEEELCWSFSTTFCCVLGDQSCAHKASFFDLHKVFLLQLG